MYVCPTSVTFVAVRVLHSGCCMQHVSFWCVFVYMFVSELFITLSVHRMKKNGPITHTKEKTKKPKKNKPLALLALKNTALFSCNYFAQSIGLP